MKAAPLPPTLQWLEWVPSDFSFREIDGFRPGWDSPVGIRPLGFARWVSPIRFRLVRTRLVGIRLMGSCSVGFAGVGIRPRWDSPGLGYARVTPTSHLPCERSFHLAFQPYIYV